MVDRLQDAVPGVEGLEDLAPLMLNAPEGGEVGPLNPGVAPVAGNGLGPPSPGSMPPLDNGPPVSGVSGGVRARLVILFVFRCRTSPKLTRMGSSP